MIDCPNCDSNVSFPHRAQCLRRRATRAFANAIGNIDALMTNDTQAARHLA